MATKKKKKGRGKAKKAEQNQEAAKQMETPDKQMERLNIDDDTEVALLDEAIKLAAAEKEALEAAVAEEQEERADKLAKNHSSGCASEQGTPDAQMQRLKIDENSQDENNLLDEAIKLAAAEKEALDAAIAEKEEISRTTTDQNNDQTEECTHGFVPSKDTDFNVEEFADAFVMSVQYAKANDTKHNTNWLDILTAARMDSAEKYPGVWIDPSKMKWVISLLVSSATEEILNGIVGLAQGCADVACYIEEFMAFISGTNSTHDDNAGTACSGCARPCEVPR
eukprot:scaffold6708_cov153-Skeletonema_marinoi.AAC.5